MSFPSQRVKKLNPNVIVLSMAPGGISRLKSSTGKPAGPYANTVPGAVREEFAPDGKIQVARQPAWNLAPNPPKPQRILAG